MYKLKNMLKKFLLIVTTLLCIIQVNAQSNKAFVVGKLIAKFTKVDMKTTTEMMGQPMEQSFITSIKSEILITSATDSEVKVQEKTINVKMAMEIMGQELNFDSDKPNENEQLKGLNDLVNKVTVITVDGNGIIKAVKYDESAEKLIQSSMGSNGYVIGQTLDFILLLPTDISIGKNWNKTIIANDSKNEYTYTVKSIDNGIANIDFVATITQDRKNEMQGNEVVTKLAGTMTGKIYVDIKTNFVTSRTTTSNLKGTVDVMGQSSPTEMTMVSEEFFQ